MRSLVSLVMLVLGACVARPLERVDVQAEPSVSVSTSSPTSEGRSDACVPLDGDARHCCPSRLGLDPERVRESCGWSEYLGELAEFSCLHAFRDGQGEWVELRVTPVNGLGFARALELLASSFVELDVEPEVWRTGSEGGEISRVAHEGANWAVVGGWPDARRVRWRTRDCADAAMLAVLVEMSEAPIDPAGAIALPEFEIDLDMPIELVGLLADRPAASSDPAASRLPDDAPAFAEAVIDRVAAEDAVGFASLLAPGARWGLPHRAQVGGRSIGTQASEVRAVLVALAHSAARMPSGMAAICPAPDRRLRAALARGEHPQWCFWRSDDGLDLLVLGLRSIDGHARLEYLGVFPDRPTAMITMSGEPPSPPVSPRPPVVCGDPHHHDPIGCPEPSEPGDAQANQRPASTIR